MHCDDPQHRPRARSDDPQLNPAARAFNPNNAVVAHGASAEVQTVDDTVPCDGRALNSAAVSLHTLRECQRSQYDCSGVPKSQIKSKKAENGLCFTGLSVEHVVHFGFT